MAASGGSPTLTAAPVRLIPLKNLRRLSGILPPNLSYFIIIIQSLQKFRGPHQGDQQIFEVKSGIAEFHEQLMDSLLVRIGFETAICIAEDLSHHTLLTHRALGQDAPQFPEIGERGVR